MSKHPSRDPRGRRVFVQDPAEAIRRIRGAGRLDPASRLYQTQMACVDAALFTRPDYAELTHLAAAVDHDTHPGSHQGGKEGRR